MTAVIGLQVVPRVFEAARAALKDRRRRPFHLVLRERPNPSILSGDVAVLLEVVGKPARRNELASRTGREIEATVLRVMSPEVDPGVTYVSLGDPWNDGSGRGAEAYQDEVAT